MQSQTKYKFLRCSAYVQLSWVKYRLLMVGGGWLRANLVIMTTRTQHGVSIALLTLYMPDTIMVLMQWQIVSIFFKFPYFPWNILLYYFCSKLYGSVINITRLKYKHNIFFKIFESKKCSVIRLRNPHLDCRRFEVQFIL